jgi:hypothetical protein
MGRPIGGSARVSPAAADLCFCGATIAAVDERTSAALTTAPVPTGQKNDGRRAWA